MGTQFSYPGIYIQEFTPGAPIQGVGTSTAAFIGTASSGPPNQPTMITSWDEFQTVFGGFINEASNLPTDYRSYLAPAVYGFFQNGGTNCYVIRVAVLLPLFASVSLPAQPPPAMPTPPPAVLTATAMNEGTNGNSILVQVKNSSRLAAMLTAAGAPYSQLTVTTSLSAPGLLTFQVQIPSPPSTFVLSQALPPGALIQVIGPTPTDTEYATVVSASVVSSGVGTVTVATGLLNTYPSAQIASVEFDLTVTAATTEYWLQLSMNPIHPNYWQTAVNSQLITLTLPATAPSPTPQNPNPAAGAYALAHGQNDDRFQDLTAATGLNTNPTHYLDMLRPLQDVDIVAIPGNTNVVVQQAVVAHCESMFNRFAVLDGLALDDTTGFTALQTQYGQVRTPNGFAAIYFPWIQVVNPLTAVTEYWPASGCVIGGYALTDQTRGVYKAPANIPIVGALGLRYTLSDADQGPLNILGINILRVFPEQSQPMVWAAHTTSTDADWRYVNVRRLFIYLEQSIQQGIRWAVFEPSGPALWAKLTRTITDFLQRVKGDGGIINFYVRIDSALNPPSVQALGQLYIEVGIQPAYPAEFIILRIGIWQGGSTMSES